MVSKHSTPHLTWPMIMTRLHANVANEFCNPVFLRLYPVDKTRLDAGGDFELELEDEGPAAQTKSGKKTN